jgi:hypothetical protein
MRVFVHIDRLVVSGRAPDRRAIETAVAEAIRRELSHRGAVEALVASGSRARVHAGRVRAEADHAALGAAVGRSMVRGGPA